MFQAETVGLCECYNSGEIGHINRNFPKKERKFNARVTDWTKEEREAARK